LWIGRSWANKQYFIFGPSAIPIQGGRKSFVTLVQIKTSDLINCMVVITG